MPHWRALRYVKDEKRRHGFGSTSAICQDVLKTDNLLHKRGHVDSQMVSTVYAFYFSKKVLITFVCQVFNENYEILHES